MSEISERVMKARTIWMMENRYAPTFLVIGGHSLLALEQEVKSLEKQGLFLRDHNTGRVRYLGMDVIEVNLEILIAGRSPEWTT